MNYLLAFVPDAWFDQLNGFVSFRLFNLQMSLLLLYDMDVLLLYLSDKTPDEMSHQGCTITHDLERSAAFV